MFVADPMDSKQDVMEINFGFQVTSLAGTAVKNSTAEDSATKDKEEATGDTTTTDD